MTEGEPMPEPLLVEADTVPSLGRGQLILVDGRTFAISDDAGQMQSATHGLVHDDLRHLSRFIVAIDRARIELLASTAPTPLSAVVVARVTSTAQPSVQPSVQAMLIRRRWVAKGLREDIHLRNTSSTRQRWWLRLHLGTDFAHVFDVKAGKGAVQRTIENDDGRWKITADDGSAVTEVRVSPTPSVVDGASGTFEWHLDLRGRSEVIISVSVEPVVDGIAAGLPFPIGSAPADAIPMRRLARWLDAAPRVLSIDPRLGPVVEQALADIAALRIIDVGHVERPVVAAGAPWFMTLFGRDSLLTAWMTLPFDPSLAGGVLASLAELQGQRYDAESEEQPGKILHELRRHGGGGPFTSRQRYFGSVDATPLFVMLAAEARRWGALSDDDVRALSPALASAVRWMLVDGDTDGDGFIDYRRSTAVGLTNQGWKDSWDGITFVDGSLPDGPIALAEVQGYAYAALIAAAELAAVSDLPLDVGDLRDRAARLRRAFNESFWDEDRGWFVLGLDGHGHRIDALGTNAGHALWTGIADHDLANRYLDHLMSSTMWTGWGLRTLADTMAAYDPLSYHNGSVWPHDTALCAAGAARYGRWDVVDRIVDGALDAASQFGGRPPELFAGISRDEAPMPVAYPASCSPQAWSSASVLLLLRTMLGLAPTSDGHSLRVGRPDLRSLPDLSIERLHFAGRAVSVVVDAGIGAVRWV